MKKQNNSIKLKTDAWQNSPFIKAILLNIRKHAHILTHKG